MIRFALVVASVLGFALTAALGNLIVPAKRALRPQETRPEDSEKEKEAEPAEPAAPPPLLGGLCLMVSVLAAAGVGWTAACVAQPELLGSQLTSRLLAALCGALVFGAVGAADDFVRQKNRSPLGLRRLPRLLLEAGAAAFVLAVLYANDWLTTGLSLPFVGYVELGAAAAPLWELGLVALAECARVSDGADGTVCGASFLAMLGLMCALTLLGWFPLAVLPAAAAGALMAFLLWNFPPAKLLCGSSGCLFLAGLVSCTPLCVGWPGLAVPLGLTFWLEGGMVALQILYARLARGRLLFRAAPLHRWLEKRGLGAVGVFYIFCALALLGAALTLWPIGRVL